MKPRCSNQRNRALTLIEVVVIIVVLGFLILALFPWPEPKAQKKTMRIQCVNNLKQIGLAYRIWASDHDDKFPMEISATNGGTTEPIGQNSWLNYLVMSNELSAPKILICPADANHFIAANFSTGFSASNISYFVGLDASTNFPAAILSGDDNLEIDGNPVKSGVVELTANSSISWTTNRHRFGNIGFADGHVEQSNNLSLTNFLRQTSLATNRLAIP